MTPFWDTDAWHRYERAYGDGPGTRSALLRSADWQTIMVDLTRDEQTMWRAMRKSYKSLVNRIAPERIDVYPVVQTFRGEAKWRVAHARRLHDQQAGRATRSKRTWLQQAAWLSSGDALLMMVDLPDPVAYAYFVVHDDWAYYFSSASLARNIMHALIWRGMLELKARGVTMLELGWAARAEDTEKDRGITKFKAGFGGALRPADYLWR